MPLFTNATALLFYNKVSNTCMDSFVSVYRENKRVVCHCFVCECISMVFQVFFSCIGNIVFSFFFFCFIQRKSIKVAMTSQLPKHVQHIVDYYVDLDDTNYVIL